VYLFYSDNISEDNGLLKDEELHHCVNVLRKKVGDVIYITDGRGNLYNGKIDQINKSSLSFKVNTIKFTEKPSIINCIAISPPKSSDRLEFFIEKAVELGIANILLFEAKRSERSRFNLERLNKIAISAMKQSKQVYKPSVSVVKNISEVIEFGKNYDQKFIAHCDGNEYILSETFNKRKSKIILIGPEGDFISEEVELAKSHQFISVSLGKNILRTETAGVYSAVLFSI
jgi:16S rRNA (uracil1498-N3)-methyltransferase